MAKKKTNGNVTHKGSSGSRGTTQQKPVKPRGCDATPGTKACTKTRNNKGMYCKNCTAWSSVGKRA